MKVSSLNLFSLSSSDWASIASLILELFECNSSVSVLVVLAEKCLGLARTDEETARLQHLLHLDGSDGSTVIEVQAVEGLESVEGRVGVQSLSQSFGRCLDSEVGPPHCLELSCCVRYEHIEPIYDSWDVIGSPSAQDLSHVGI